MKYDVEFCKYVISFSEYHVHGFRIFLLLKLSSSAISILGFSCLDELIVGEGHIEYYGREERVE